MSYPGGIHYCWSGRMRAIMLVHQSDGRKKPQGDGHKCRNLQEATMARSRMAGSWATLLLPKALARALQITLTPSSVHRIRKMRSPKRVRRG